MAYGFGSGEGGLEERPSNAVEEGAIGCAVGATLPPVARVVSNTLAGRAAREATSAGDRMIRDDLAAERMAPDDIGAAASAIGPDAMPADVSPALRMRTEQIAQSDNRGRPVIIDALSSRKAAAEGRTGAAFHDAMGPAPSVQDELDRLLSEARDAPWDGASGPDRIAIAKANGWGREQAERMARTPFANLHPGAQAKTAAAMQQAPENVRTPNVAAAATLEDWPTDGLPTASPPVGSQSAPDRVPRAEIVRVFDTFGGTNFVRRADLEGGAGPVRRYTDAGRAVAVSGRETVDRDLLVPGAATAREALRP
ncbi:hypothetical protein ACRC7T_18965 [Segnochrobactraceae bacterium EtOH-i3]